MKRTPARSIAAAIARASSRVVAIGFSHSTCLPRAAARSISGRCAAVSEQTATASTASSSASSDGTNRVP